MEHQTHAEYPQYLDKNSINFASVYGLKSGTHLKGQQYSWLSKFALKIQKYNSLIRLGSIFYFGYLIAQWPAGLALQKLPVGKYMAITTLSKNQRS